MLHAGYSYSLPILRSAVPVFFIISSYLFFKKVDSLDSIIDKKQYLKKFVLRACKLYLFWFILLFPITVWVRGFIHMNIFEISYHLLFEIFFSSTFPASWYISAYIIGISIVFFFRKEFYLILIIGLILYLYCCTQSNYYYLFKPLNINILQNSEFAIYNSFPVGIFFICIGRYFAKKNIFSLKYGLIGTFTGIILISIENYMVQDYNWGGVKRLFL